MNQRLKAYDLQLKAPLLFPLVTRLIVVFRFALPTYYLGTTL